MHGYGFMPPPQCRGQFRFIRGDCHVPPHDAVYAGTDKDGGVLYAGRAHHEGDMIPAKVAPAHGGAFVPWGGQEHSKFEFEYLQSNHAVWKFARNGEAPPEAIVFGKTRDGENLYMGRVMHDGALTPGKYLQSNHAVWKFARNGEAPPEAIVFGKTRDGENLYMGRVMHDGALTPGKVQPSHGCLYIPYGGQELSFKEYEVLMLL